MNEVSNKGIAKAGSTTVLIVGAGPTGLTLAVSLARSGVPFRLIDAEPGPRPGSRGKGVQPRSLEIFEDLGIAKRVIANGRMAMPMDSTDPEGHVIHGGAVPASLRDRPDIPYAASLITPEWRVEEALRLQLETLGGRIEFGVELVSLAQGGDQVTADIVSDGVTSTIAARWLVGADGGHSITRKQIGVSFVGETREDVRVTLADLPVSGLGTEAWETWRHADGIMSLCPLPSTDLFQYMAGLAPGVEPRLDLTDLQATLEKRTGRIDIRLHEPVWTSVWRANIRLVNHYRVNSVFLAGDAAHIHSQAGGQGMNTGIQDAYNLAWKFAAVVNDAAPVQLLDTYEAERRPIAAHVLALSNERLAETLKTNSVPVERDASTIELDVGYRGSELAWDDRDDQSSLRAGDRAPDATGLTTADGVHRLFDLIGGGRFTLLCFGPATPAGLSTSKLRILHVVSGQAREGDIADNGDNLVHSYRASRNSLVLIRPDGYIGLISDAGDPGTVTGYLAGFTSGH